METNKNVKTVKYAVRIKGFLTLLLGVIHIIATYFEYNSIKSEMNKDHSYQYAIWFFVVGIYFVFIGTIELFSVKGIKQGAILAWKIAMVSSIFTSVTGLLGIVAFKAEPGPPYLLFAFGFICFLILLKYRNEFTKT